MPSIPLPENASLEHLRKQAKLVQDLVRSGDQGALDMIDELHPQPARARSSAAHFRRSDAQLLVARLYGFASWTKLREHLGVVSDLSRPDPADRDHDDVVDRFVAIGCVSYGDDDAHDRLARARALLAADPDLGTRSLAAACTTGRYDVVATMLADDPALANEPCGPNAWPPLLYCTYSRVDEQHGLQVAETLLTASADADAGFLWRGLVPPFTALTGAFGRGEQDQPPHPQAIPLARLLLEAGADPNDGQTLYNNGLAGSPHDDPTHLELLVEHGLGQDRGGLWYRRLGDRLTPPAELLHDELEVAAYRGLPRRMNFLVTLDLDLDRPVGRSRQPAARLAVEQGHDEVVAILAAAGASIPGGPA